MKKHLRPIVKPHIKAPKIDDNLASNVIIIREFSKHYHKEINSKDKYKPYYDGTMQSHATGTIKQYKGPANLLIAFEKLNKECEQHRKKHKFPTIDDNGNKNSKNRNTITVNGIKLSKKPTNAEIIKAVRKILK